MAKWDVPDYRDELDKLRKQYVVLAREHEKLKQVVTCDFYEAYLLEKAKREKLEQQIAAKLHDNVVKEEDVHQVAGFEYYNHE